jgi:hypothetical protein
LRGKLPTWVVRIRSRLEIIAAFFQRYSG